MALKARRVAELISVEEFTRLCSVIDRQFRTIGMQFSVVSVHRDATTVHVLVEIKHLTLRYAIATKSV